MSRWFISWSEFIVRGFANLSHADRLGAVISDFLYIAMVSAVA